MEVILECVDSVNLQTSSYSDRSIEIKKGDTVLADFSSDGVRFLLNNVWSMPFHNLAAEKWFKVKGQ